MLSEKVTPSANHEHPAHRKCVKTRRPQRAAVTPMSVCMPSPTQRRRCNVRTSRPVSPRERDRNVGEKESLHESPLALLALQIWQISSFPMAP